MFNQIAQLLTETVPIPPLYTPDMVQSGITTVMDTLGPLVVACVPLMFVFIAIKIGPKLIRQFFRL